MVFSTFMFTRYHDLFTMIASIFGMVAVIGIMKYLYFEKLIMYVFNGFFCIVLLGINNIIYYSEKFIYWLPLLQKVTMLFVFAWIIAVNREIKKRIEHHHGHL